MGDPEDIPVVSNVRSRRSPELQRSMMSAVERAGATLEAMGVSGAEASLEGEADC